MALVELASHRYDILLLGINAPLVLRSHSLKVGLSSCHRLFLLHGAFIQRTKGVLQLLDKLPLDALGVILGAEGGDVLDLLIFVSHEHLKLAILLVTGEQVSALTELGWLDLEAQLIYAAVGLLKRAGALETCCVHAFTLLESECDLYIGSALCVSSKVSTTLVQLRECHAAVHGARAAHVEGVLCLVSCQIRPHSLLTPLLVASRLTRSSSPVAILAPKQVSFTFPFVVEPDRCCDILVPRVHSTPYRTVLGQSGVIHTVSAVSCEVCQHVLCLFDS